LQCFSCLFQVYLPCIPPISYYASSFSLLLNFLPIYLSCQVLDKAYTWMPDSEPKDVLMDDAGMDHRKHYHARSV
jgi:hypothetical protein